MILPKFNPELVASAGLIAVGGMLIAWARNLPKELWTWLQSQFTVSVECRDQELVKWIGIAAAELWGIHGRRTSAMLRNGKDGEAAEVLLEPARGRHLVRYRGRFVSIWRSKESPEGANLGFIVETVDLTTPGRNPAILREMIDEAMLHGRKRFADRSPIRLQAPWGDWLDLPDTRMRSLESLILPEREGERIRDAIAKFLASPDWYALRGVPWRIGIGLFGPPGTGKSSLVRAICGELGLPLHILSLGGKSLDDSALLRLMAEAGPRSAILLDDLDANQLPSRESAAGGVTLAGLLAALDGPAATEGRVLFICTNHPERLDPALLRPGRVDISSTLGVATREQARRLYLRWHPEGDEVAAERFARDGEGKVMAELQGRLMGHIGEAQEDEEEATA